MSNMEALEDSLNCHSSSNSFSLYERYMRSFSVCENQQDIQPRETQLYNNSTSRSAFEPIVNRSHADPSTVVVTRKHLDDVLIEQNQLVYSKISDDVLEKKSTTSDQSDFFINTLADGSFEHSVVTENSSAEKSSNLISEDSKSDNSNIYPKPVIITSLITMENSNNAVDSVPMFRDIDTVFKLPITELSFNGTIKHVQELKPMIDPITVLSSVSVTKSMSVIEEINEDQTSENIVDERIDLGENVVEVADENRLMEEFKESTGDYVFSKKVSASNMADETRDSKYSLEQSTSSLEASFDSGVRSPDMFFEDDDFVEPPPSENFWDFIKDHESQEKTCVKNFETLLGGVLPPPSVTMIKLDVSEMLKKYYCFLPAFNDDRKEQVPDVNPSTPDKGVSYVEIPENINGFDEIITIKDTDNRKNSEKKSFIKNWYVNTENDAKTTNWPDLMKCRYHDVHYNITNYSEKAEVLAMKLCQKFVGAETASSVTVYSGSLASPSSASKRKALRLKMNQAKSPSRRLSHLARRRQTFASAETIKERAQLTTSRMVLIDKNFFPHRKLTYTSERKSPRVKRTPNRKTPGKKTPAKTPKTKSGGSTKKRVMRRLLMDTDSLSRSLPTRETSKRALFISPSNKKISKEIPTTSVPQAINSRRVLFGSPSNSDRKNLESSNESLKRKRDTFDGIPENESRSKIAKSLSFGGDSCGAHSSEMLTRRASDISTFKREYELNELHKQKLLWAVAEALRAHGWRTGATGAAAFREKAAALFRLARRLLALPAHRALLHAPRRSTSTSELMLKLARQYAFAIIQGRTIEDCVLEEQMKLMNNGVRRKPTGYISASDYEAFKARQSAPSTLTSSQIKENCVIVPNRNEPRNVSNSKNILQDKLVNMDSNSNSSSLGMSDKSVFFKSNSMPSFDEAAKMRARRQISFDSVDLPKR